ncbi:hypothetical protein LTR62_007047 [Meristemomyces frigidus]|uniref:Glycoside hydrolase family 5 protein n=1 Tax=Meristemomyces frigidus TaxID=1508187 RepID=A0AAN7TCR7_9PEZI|nr:hypothetical protein LTR62_007047 [Meristemomyces frigidus]
MTTILLAMLAASAVQAGLVPRSNKCSGGFTRVSAQTWLDNANPGWNLGNTLDAIPTEGSWNNPPVVVNTFSQIQSAGFKGMRLPITWIDHFASGSPSWTVNATWLQRVSDVVDESISRGFHTILNVHHDATDWADVTAAGANYTAIEDRFYALWFQIATNLACKSSLLAFEPLNEPPATTQAHYDEINKLNTIFVKAINDAGGFNPNRVVTLVGPSEDGSLTSQFFKRPTNITNPWAIQYHYYSPYDFIFGAWGKTIWGSDADKQALEANIAEVRGNFTDVPLVIGEWSAAGTYTETSARWKYSDFLMKTAAKYNTATYWWDNGATDFDRGSGKFRDPVVKDIIVQAAQGKTNSLADSTEDESGLTQVSSAYLYHTAGKAPTPPTDLTASYLLNGNTITSVRSPSGQTLSKGPDYTVTGGNVTFKAPLISKYITPHTPFGQVANFTILFSHGATLQTTLVKLGQSKLATNTSIATASTATTDLRIPVTYATIPKVAAVQAKLADGTCLFDTWTVYLPAIQQCRSTYGNQWDYDGASVTISAAAVQAVVAAGQTTTFVVEFYPRMPGNSATFVMTLG